jgi:hypothetical protein
LAEKISQFGLHEKFMLNRTDLPFDCLEALPVDEKKDGNNNSDKWIISSFHRDDIFSKLDTNTKFSYFFNANRRVSF